jgi:hypothetical protein
MPETGERQYLSSEDETSKPRRSSSSGKREKQISFFF